MTVCELCTAADVIAEDALAYARYDSNPLCRGHVIVVPRRHVADFFEMTAAEQDAVMKLLLAARRIVAEKHSPEGYNIGAAAGQSRMHVHFHLIPRHRGDVEDPRGGIRCVLKQ